MWQTLILSKWNPVFEWIPIENMIYARQDEYYAAIQMSTDATDSRYFIEFSLETILDALKDLDERAQEKAQKNPQVERLLKAMGSEILSAKEIMKRLNLTHIQSFRRNYLNPAFE